MPIVGIHLHVLPFMSHRYNYSVTTLALSLVLGLSLFYERLTHTFWEVMQQMITTSQLQGKANVVLALISMVYEPGSKSPWASAIVRLLASIVLLLV